MDDGRLWLDEAERQFLAYSLAVDDLWPASEAQSVLLREVPGSEVAGGPRLRATLLAMALRGGEEEMPLTVTASELWLLDSLLIRRDLRREKLSDGRPLVELATKVWRLLLDAYADQLPPHLLEREMHDAEPNEEPDEDAGTIIASAEAILRSGHGEGAGKDLLSTEA